MGLPVRDEEHRQAELFEGILRHKPRGDRLARADGHGEQGGVAAGIPLTNHAAEGVELVAPGFDRGWNLNVSRVHRKILGKTQENGGGKNPAAPCHAVAFLA
jgi:hypothetical protein